MERLLYYKPFAKLLDQLSRRHDRGRIFGDFLTLATCALHPQTLAHPGHNPDPANEAEYLGTSKSYTREELNGVAELLALVVVQAREEPFSDLLGEYFVQEVTRGHNGQFFTPDSICTLMARMTAGDAPPEGKTVYDPACGSGRLLLAFAEDAPLNVFFAGDVDVRCARMTALNFYANGLRGEVAHMNALSMECWRGWHVHDERRGILPVAPAQVVQAGRLPARAAEPQPLLTSPPATRPPAPARRLPAPAPVRPPAPPAPASGQLGLF